MNKFFDLFLTFGKIGVLTFGGGYAMLSMLEREVVDKKKWVEREELLDYFAIGQCTPGVIAVNTATLLGYKQKKISGGIAATLGIISPSIIIICIIALFLQGIAGNEIFINAMLGIRIAVGALILSAVIRLLKSSIVDIVTFLLFIAGVISILFLNFSPVLSIIIAAFLGVLIKVIITDLKSRKK